jgi:anti-anti-sigma factor
MAANPVSHAPELKVETEKTNSGTIVRATGRIVVETSTKLESTLRDLMPEGKRIMLDLTSVDYIDSAGLGALVSVYMHARRTSCALEIANPKQSIRDLFNRSGLGPVFKGERFDVFWKSWSCSD